jgi:hypothetical protein
MKVQRSALVPFMLSLLCLSPVLSKEIAAVTWNLEENHRQVTVKFSTTPPASMKMDAGEVEDVLLGLGTLRGEMWPEVPKIYKLGQKQIEAVDDPIWSTEPEATLGHGDTILHIRDPRYGWLHYLVPREEAAKLAALLLRQATAPLASPRPDNPN